MRTERPIGSRSWRSGFHDDGDPICRRTIGVRLGKAGGPGEEDARQDLDGGPGGVAKDLRVGPPPLVATQQELGRSSCTCCVAGPGRAHVALGMAVTRSVPLRPYRRNAGTMAHRLALGAQSEPFRRFFAGSQRIAGARRSWDGRVIEAQARSQGGPTAATPACVQPSSRRGGSHPCVAPFLRPEPRELARLHLR